MKTERKTGARPGRPRNDDLDRRVLQTTWEQVQKVGFRATSMESISAQSGVVKASIYRRWPNKAAVVMDAFMEEIGRGTAFPESASALESVRIQMRAQARAFRGSFGTLMKSLLGEAQFDAELAEALRERWIMPRRTLIGAVLQRAVAQGELPPGTDIDRAIDLLYAPIYYRLQLGTGPLSDSYVEGVFQQVLRGLNPAKFAGR